jgi:hypothetical protein
MSGTTDGGGVARDHTVPRTVSSVLLEKEEVQLSRPRQDEASGATEGRILCKIVGFEDRAGATGG